MRTTILCAVLVLLAPAASRAAGATVSVGVSVPLPVVTFQVAPRLVVVEPGVQVVPDYDDEVFFVSGYYWTRADGRWYRARDHRGRWAYVGPRYVPARLVKIPPGHYRRYRVVERERVIVRDHDHGHRHGHDHGHKHDHKHGHDRHRDHDD